MMVAKWIVTRRVSIGLLLLVSMLFSGGSVRAGTVTYYYTDPQGTPLAQADAQGNITATFDYRPYGAQALGTPPKGPGYTGHVNDPDTGLVYMQARYYDPVVGRFLSADPLGPAVGNVFNFGRYEYANNNPILNIDPDGRKADPDPSPGCDVGASCESCGSTTGCGGTGHRSSSQELGETSDTSGSNSSVGKRTGHVAIGVGKAISNGLSEIMELISPPEGEPLRPSDEDEAAGMVLGGVIVQVTEVAVTEGKSSEASAAKFEELVAAAQKKFPGKAGKIELHHITPKYLGGAKDGPLVRIDAAYHQQITNEFRSRWPYSIGTPSDVERSDIMSRVYSKYPLAPGN
jgi:RHS repeat-associated protein